MKRTPRRSAPEEEPLEYIEGLLLVEASIELAQYGTVKPALRELAARHLREQGERRFMEVWGPKAANRSMLTKLMAKTADLNQAVDGGSLKSSVMAVLARWKRPATDAAKVTREVQKIRAGRKRANAKKNR